MTKNVVSLVVVACTCVEKFDVVIRWTMASSDKSVKNSISYHKGMVGTPLDNHPDSSLGESWSAMSMVLEDVVETS